MEIPEIQYQPGQVSPSFNPVTQVDVTQGLRENQQRTAQQMQSQLSQMQRNAGIQLQNLQSQAFPIEQLTELSNTAAKLMEDKAEQMKSDLEAEMTMLAYQDGFSPTKEFEQSEQGFQKTGKQMDERANTYQKETGDYEGAERIRELSGWKKYYYAKAQAEMAGKNFGAFLNENASRQVPVNGEMVSLKQANAEQRAAVVAYLSSEYMQPFQGMNKSFLGKYLFPGMQKGQASTMAALSAERQKIIKANQLDEAGVLFRNNVTAEGAQQFRDTLLAQGYTNAEIRAQMLSNANTVAEVEAIGAIEFGGNGKTFAENYGKEYNEALNSATSRQNDANDRFEAELRQADQAAKIDYIKAEQNDLKDGSFDANPATLQAKADEARKAGHTDTARYIESRIAETVAAKTSTAIRKGYELQIQAGVVPSEEEILLNPALTQEDKAALIGKATENAGKVEPKDPRAKSHKEEIKEEIEARAQWTKDKGANPSITGMNFRAWKRYTEVYNNAIESGKTADAAAQEAMADFRNEFGDDPGKGTYAVGQDPNNPKGLFTYSNYDRTAAASTTTSPLSQVNSKFSGKTAEQRNDILNNQPDLFYGEERILQSLQENASTTGKLGAIPPVYYQLQQRYGGRVSILDMVQQRLKANGLKPLPDSVTSVVSEVQGAFDEDSYKYINYKPNATRTDIGLISSGQAPVYLSVQPVQRQALDAIAKSESGSYGYDAVNQGGERGGTKTRGFSGRYSQMPTRRYNMPLTQMTIGQILQEGDPRFNTLTTKQFEAAGGIHAVGRYQIINSTLKGLVQRHNIPLDTVFSPEVQDFLALSLLNSGGDGQWVGPSEADRVIIRRGRSLAMPVAPWRQPINMRPELLQ